MSLGLPHSSHSIAERGREVSRIVVTTSTKGTSATTTLNKSGRIFITAPINKPPALPPVMARRSLAVQFSAIKYSAQAIKSVKVFFFCKNFPCSYHCRPISSPPRIWAMANTTPRSNNVNLLDENDAG